MKRWLDYALAAVILGLGYYLAFQQPSELAKSLAVGEMYAYLAPAGASSVSDLVAVRRDISPNLSVADAAPLILQKLLEGPNTQDTQSGLMSLLPANEKIVEAIVSKHSVRVKLEVPLEGESGLLAQAEIRKTLERLPGIWKVIIE